MLLAFQCRGGAATAALYCMTANPLNSSKLPVRSSASHDRLRVATYNIHKGVRGVGPLRRLEIQNLGLGVQALDADLVFLQEVRSVHRSESRRFYQNSAAWSDAPQAEALAPARLCRCLSNQRDHARRRARQRPAVALADRRHRPSRRVGSSLRAAWAVARAGAVERPRRACRGGALRPHPCRPRAPGRAAGGLHRPARAGRRAAWWWRATSTTGARSSTC